MDLEEKETLGDFLILASDMSRWLNMLQEKSP